MRPKIQEMKNILCYLLLTIVLGAGCHRSVHPVTTFDPVKIPAAPDYADLKNWAAHPDLTDPADQTPCPDIKNEEATAEVDVFFVHPTTYTGSDKNQTEWNGALNDQALNQKTDNGSILFQASIFNGAGRVFAPRYRQAHLHSFFTEDKKSAGEALDVAYQDVIAAFDYYLKHWNKGRPFILAGHSQGALHIMTLIHDRIEGQALEQQLIAAYIVGWPVQADYYKQFKPCESPDQTDCYCTWRTWERNFGLKKFAALNNNVVCTNPLTWSTKNRGFAPKTANLGGVVRPFCAVYPNITDAEVLNGFLLCTKPKFPGSILYRTHNYHPGDFNLYYMNVRQNVQARKQAYLKK
jgi:hypothetical protein